MTHWLGLMVLAATISAACGGRTDLPSPLVRVDLTHHLPPKALKRLQALGGAYPCSRTVVLKADGAHQGFVVSWRLFELDNRRYFTAVQVEPKGPTAGATFPEATATVDEPKARGKVSTLPVHLSWSAREGCSTVSARKTVTLSSDDSSCRPPKKTKLGIFKKEAKSPADAGPD